MQCNVHIQLCNILDGSLCMSAAMSARLMTGNFSALMRADQAWGGRGGSPHPVLQHGMEPSFCRWVVTLNDLDMTTMSLSDEYLLMHYMIVTLIHSTYLSIFVVNIQLYYCQTVLSAVIAMTGNYRHSTYWPGRCNYYGHALFLQAWAL